jgi:hypothetical protein
LFQGQSPLMFGNMEQHPGPNIKSFFHDIWYDWGARMSGLFTVPFTVAALFAPSEYRAIFAVMAILAFAITAYRIWADERARLVVLEQHLAPRLRIEFDPHQAKFLHHTVTTTYVNMIYVRVVARALSPVVEECRGYLQRISQWDGNQYITLFDETLELPWSGDHSDTEPRLINHEVDAFLDVAWVADSEFAPPPFGFLNHQSTIPNRLLQIVQNQIEPHGEQNLKLDLLITGRDCENAHLSLNIHRSPNGEWDALQVGWMDAVGNAIHHLQGHV